MTGSVRVVGLGPAGLDRLSTRARSLLEDPSVVVVARTIDHPAARQLSEIRSLVPCDDLYEAGATFEEVYDRIVERIIDAAATTDVVYAVPGHSNVAEKATRLLMERGVVTSVIGGESFIDATFEAIGFDPFDRGFQVIDAHALPHPLTLSMPTLIGQVDSPSALNAVRDGLLTLLDGDTEVTILANLGDDDHTVRRIRVSDLRPAHAGLRVSVFVDVPAPGWAGLVQTSARLRRECPWDREQTHHSLAKHLLEEAHEVLEAIDALGADAPAGAPDVAAYVDLEEELGDLLIQIVLHATLASEAGMFGIEEVAESVRRKLVARHPHVFGDVEATTSGEVMANWEALKQDEKARQSRLDGIPAGLPALGRAFELQARAASVGFDWPTVEGAFDKVTEEAREVMDAPAATRSDEFGDLLFSLVNVARHLAIDPEQALRRAAATFERRFRAIEAEGELSGLTLDQMDERWNAIKNTE